MNHRQDQAREKEISSLAAREMAHRLNTGETLDEMARESGVEREVMEKLASTLFEQYPEARAFKHPDLDIRPIAALHHAI